ncbi:transcriptional regulator, LacI family [Pseudopedobacter saltans DSM 12145]|uniref:Transcriptional regulator, LacI family n=1 Tax=Pseudopedobacter saltans (strain ATCC 51119 / DSM 12145 / JCM 21818 / CCUG 39354 / LMG 10337 / NBRC 100064 / NCIMB 13643) TaxID=762903 RepID=F0S6Y1_PSESL|nr:LacI family DNA-binding transcriptional regulator [Pseudopedobacter saltans]ADY53244.1 transcriptional regulator, LacI family [Pseudopedobacter saltans DSM 12145]
MSQKEITIYDIAEKLAISAATVSRALQNHPAVNAKTKKRIVDLANELGYQSNKFASNLRKQKTHTIGVIVPRLNSAFMSTVLSGIEKVANNAGYNLIISQSFETHDKEAQNAQTMFNNRVDALVISLAYDTKDYKHLNSFIKKKIPIIFFDRVADKIDATKVLIDNFKAGYQATEHLIQQGCKEILHITGNLSRNVYNDRFEGYKKALEDNGIKYDQKLLICNDLSEKAIEDCLKNDVLKRTKLPDGLFITSDPSAAYALTILKEAGVKVPQDMAIIGFNNDLISRVCEPAISTINYPGNQMGETIARILINHLNGESDINYMNTVILKTDLIVRNSSLKKK